MADEFNNVGTGGEFVKGFIEDGEDCGDEIAEEWWRHW